MAFLPPDSVLDIMEKLDNDKELTEDESKLLSAYAKKNTINEAKKF